MQIGRDSRWATEKAETDGIALSTHRLTILSSLQHATRGKDLDERGGLCSRGLFHAGSYISLILPNGITGLFPRASLVPQPSAHQIHTFLMSIAAITPTSLGIAP